MIGPPRAVAALAPGGAAALRRSTSVLAPGRAAAALAAERAVAPLAPRRSIKALALRCSIAAFAPGRSVTLVALLAACGAPVPEDRSTPTPVQPAIGPPPATCDAHDELGGAAWLPADVRLAVIVDLDSGDLAAANNHLAAGVQAGRGLPVVAALGLGQLGLQLGILRPQLITAGLRPRELMLLHDRTGAVIWVLRARCDLAAIQAGMTAAWSLQVRKISGGEVAESPRGPTGAARVAFDVAFLPDDRIALTPPGSAAAVHRWLGAGPAAPGLGAGPAVAPPGEVLDEIPAAPIRGVLAGRALQSDGAADAPLVRTLRATATALEVDGQP